MHAKQRTHTNEYHGTPNNNQQQ